MRLRVCGDLLRKPRQELRNVDEVHVREDVTIETQDPEGGAKEKLLTVPAKHVPHATCNVQWQGLTVQSEDPTHTNQ